MYIIIIKYIPPLCTQHSLPRKAGSCNTFKTVTLYYKCNHIHERESSFISIPSLLPKGTSAEGQMDVKAIH